VTPRVAIATCAELPLLDRDAGLFRDALVRHGAHVSPVVWDDPGWLADDFDAVVLRSTWDYQFKMEEFLDWSSTIGTKLYNPPEVVRWNIDKRYLLELADARIPIVPSTFISPGHELPPMLNGKFVVKPSVSAGSKDTAVYDDGRLPAARAHMSRLLAQGRSVLIQPYLSTVDHEAETAVIFVDGRACHAMRKGPLLELDEPLEADLFRQEQMSRRNAGPDILALASRAVDFVSKSFGAVPLYGRADVLRDDAGNPAILELELIEPSLFLDFYPSSADMLARSLLRRLRGAA
jgi:hypothetical protein